jgi:hypothetical protein
MERYGMYRLMFASSSTAKSQDGGELFNISQESFQVLVDAFGSELSPSARAREASRVWVAMHGIVMLAKQGLLKGGVTAASLDRLIEDCITPPV